MKKLVLLVATCLLIGTQVVSAQDDSKIFNEKERAGARKALAKMFEIDLPQEQTTETAGEKSKLNLAEVADKLVDKASDSVAYIAAKIENVAPEVWRIMIKQQYANAVEKLLLPWGLVGVTFLFVILAKNRFRESDDDDPKDWDSNHPAYWCVKVVPTFLAAAFSIWGVIASTTAIKMLINPEYYAIRDLLTMLFKQQGI